MHTRHRAEIVLREYKTGSHIHRRRGTQEAQGCNEHGHGAQQPPARRTDTRAVEAVGARTGSSHLSRVTCHRACISSSALGALPHSVHVPTVRVCDLRPAVSSEQSTTIEREHDPSTCSAIAHPRILVCKCCLSVECCDLCTAVGVGCLLRALPCRLCVQRMRSALPCIRFIFVSCVPVALSY